MCGICGIKNYNENNISQVITNMMNAMFHRGPDEEGKKFYKNNKVVLGHKRLSIIDLHEGQQPMMNEDESIAIVFNGEIYNYKKIRRDLEKKGHKFRTNSDTESLLHLYEEEGKFMFDKINGMFAFAIWDNRQKRLFLARDRIGIKPLYYTTLDNTFIFASEIGPILTYPGFRKQINANALFQYLNLRCVPSPHTMFEGIYKLQPGSFLLVDHDTGKVRVKKESFWRIEDCLKKEYLNNSEVFDTLDKTLIDAVEKRMISDVPIGAFLSGGIDSTMIVNHMSRNSQQQINTYTLGFYNDPKNELKYAQIAAKHCLANHHEIIISQNDFLKLLPFIINCFDDPVADGAALPIYLMSDAAKKDQGIKVMLSGEGCDELHGGYSSYLSHITLYKIYKALNIFPNSFSKSLLSTMSKTGYKKIFLSKIDTMLSQGTPYPGHSSNQIGDVSLVFKKNIKTQIDKHYFKNIMDKLDQYNLSFIEKMLFIDMKYRMPDDLLTRLDRMTMAASVEGRVPFLDHRFVEFSMRTRPNLKIKREERKYLIKKIAEAHIPHEIIYRQKSGFPVPMKTWLESDKKDTYINIILQHDANVFDMDYLKNILNSHYLRQTDHTLLIWRLFFFSLWYKRWFLNENLEKELYSL